MPDVPRAQLRARQAWFTALIGLPDQGLQMAQESIATLKHYDQDISIESWEGININAIFLNRLEIVSQTSQEMMTRAERSGDVWDQGWSLIWFAYALVLQRRIDEALQAAQEALAVFEKLGNLFGLSVASGIILGSIAMAMGDIRGAKTYLLRGAQAAEEHNYLRILQIVYDSLGTVALMEDDVEQAQQYFFKSLNISQKCGQTREMLASLRDFASVYMARGDAESALHLLAVVLSHPASDQNSLNRPERLRDEAEKLRAQVETELDSALYQSAWKAGQKQKLAEVVTQILN